MAAVGQDNIRLHFVITEDNPEPYDTTGNYSWKSEINVNLPPDNK
jgi:hypothetical protein